MIYFCCDERRREAVRDDGRLNGIDFLEVEDRPEDPDDLRQRRLFVHMLQDVARTHHRYRHRWRRLPTWS
jgi:hypothetical protein